MCHAYCSVLAANPALTPQMPNLHSRLKKPIGDRLAAAAFRAVYEGEAGAARSGPTLSGCAVRGERLVVAFNASLFGNESLRLHRYRRTAGRELSLFEVLPAGSPFCAQTMHHCSDSNSSELKTVYYHSASNCHFKRREWFCPKGFTAPFDPERLRGPGVSDFVPIPVWEHYTPQYIDPWERDWVSLNITHSSAFEVSADLTPLKGVPVAFVRYAWGVNRHQRPERLCCDEDDPDIGLTKPCDAPCPITTSGGLPANPFLARIEKGRCECIPPQVCDEGKRDVGRGRRLLS